MGTAMNPPGQEDEHTGWDELAVGWALHALEPADEAVFAAHLTGCHRCGRTVAETFEVMAVMAGDLPRAEPSAGLRDRLRVAVERTEQVPAAPRPADAGVAPGPAPSPAPPPAAEDAPGDLRAPRSRRAPDPRPAWRRLMPPALVAAAVAAVLSLGAWNVIVTHDRDAARATAAEQSQLLDALLEPGRATVAPLVQDGRDVATVIARPDRVQVVANGLPVNDRTDTVYVVWGIEDGTAAALGTFDVVTPQVDLRTVGSSATGLDQYSAYGISIEPGRQAPSQPTEVVATGEVAS